MPYSLGSQIIVVRCSDKTAIPSHVHEHLLRQRSRDLADRIDNAREEDENDSSITISLLGSAKHRWCVWLYGQPLRKYGEEPDQALLDIAGIYEFPVEEESYECANACLDAIRELLVEEHGKTTIHLSTLLGFLDKRQEATQILIDMLVYGPFAASGKTREWLSETIVRQVWASFFHRLSLAFATKVENEAAGKENKRPDFMAPDAYHIPTENSNVSHESAAKSSES